MMSFFKTPIIILALVLVIRSTPLLADAPQELTEEIYYKDWNFQTSHGFELSKDALNSVEWYYKACYVALNHHLSFLEKYQKGTLVYRVDFNNKNLKKRSEWYDLNHQTKAFEDYHYGDGKRTRIKHEVAYYQHWNEELDNGEDRIEPENLSKEPRYYRVLMRTEQEDLTPLEANYLDFEDYLTGYEPQKLMVAAQQDIAFYSEWDYETEVGLAQIISQPVAITQSHETVQSSKIIEPFDIPFNDVVIRFFSTWDYGKQSGTELTGPMNPSSPPTEYFKIYSIKEHPELIFQVDYFKANQLDYRTFHRINLSKYFQEWAPKNFSDGMFKRADLKDPTHCYQAFYNYYHGLVWLDHVDHLDADTLVGREFFTIREGELSKLFQIIASDFYWNPFEFIDQVFHVVLQTNRIVYRRIFQTNLPYVLKREHIDEGTVVERILFNQAGKPVSGERYTKDGSLFQNLTYTYNYYGYLTAKEAQYYGKSMEKEEYFYDQEGYPIRINFYHQDRLRKYKLFHYDSRRLERKEEIFSSETEKLIEYCITKYKLNTKDKQILERKDYYRGEVPTFTYHFHPDNFYKKIDVYDIFGDLKVSKYFEDKNTLIKEEVYKKNELCKYWNFDNHHSVQFFDANHKPLSQNDYERLQ